MNHCRLAIVAALLIAPACSSTTEEDEELYLPTEAEAQAKADQAITDANADAEYAKLMEEIEAEAEER